MVYSDASHANICEGTGSVGGSVIFLVGESNKCCPLSWKCSKLKRVCRSSAAAEGMSLSESLDEAVYLRQLLCHVLGLQKASVPIGPPSNSKFPSSLKMILSGNNPLSRLAP